MGTRPRFYTDDRDRVRPVGQGETPPQVRIIRRFKEPGGYDYAHPRRIEPMLAVEGKGSDLDSHGYEASRKYDGRRTIPIKCSDKIMLRGRSWANDCAQEFPEIVRELQTIQGNYVLDSELCFFEKGTDKEVFNPENKPRYDAKLMVFDILYDDDECLKNEPYEERQRRLRQIISPSLKHVDVVETVTQGKRRFYRSILAKGGEGVVLKERRSHYLEGKRGSEWLKVKEWKTDEAVVVGVTVGEGKRSGTFGSLVLAKRGRDGRWHYVGSASGFSDEEGKRLLAELSASRRSVPPLPARDVNRAVKFWVDPRMVVEVKYFQKSPDGVYRFPDYLRRRDDKKPEEVKL